MRLSICKISDLGENQSVKFKIPLEKFDREGLAVNRGGTFFAYYNECPHIGLPLDWDDNDFFSLDMTSLVCKNHGAFFTPESGECTAGPCRDKGLKPIAVLVEIKENQAWLMAEL